MKRKVKIFIYALVAWFVGMAVIVYDFAVSYAASFNDVAAADWRTFVKGSYDGGGDRQVSYGDYPNDENMLIEGYELSKQYKYTEQAVLAAPGSESYPWSEVFNLSSDSEIVCLILWSTTEEDVTATNKYAKEGYSSGFSKDAYTLCFFSKSSIRFRQSYCMRRNGVWAHEASVEQYYGESVSSVGDSLVGFAYVGQIQNNAVLNIKTGSMKTFTDFKSMANYFETGDTSGMAWCGAAPEYDGENIYLNDFEMWVHDSNAYSAYYIEFKYTIPDQLKTAESLVLDIAEQYSYCVTAVASLARLPSEYSGTNKIDLLQYPSGFKLYLKDINAVKSFVDKAVLSTDGMAMRRVLGSEGYLDSDYLSLDGLGLNTICQITNSKLYLTCYVVANGKYGQSVNGDVDFLSGSNGMGTYTPDASGNYSYNGDYKNNGHYYDQVGTDAAGNVSHTYYYYDTDNSKNNITSNDFSNNTYTPGASSSVGAVIQNNNVTLPDHIFVTVSGSSGSSGSGSDVGNVTIEDDDLSFDSLRESIKDGYGLIDDTDTGVKGDGLIAMLSDLFGYLPAKFVGLIMLGTSSVVGIAVLRMIFKR